MPFKELCGSKTSTYPVHDLDDGIRAGLFSLDEVAADVPFTAACLAVVTARWPGLSARRRLVPELVREQIGRMTDDLLTETRARLTAAAPQSVADVRAAGRSLVGMSKAMVAEAEVLKNFLRARMYRHPQVAALRDPSRDVVTGLFAALHADPTAMPGDWVAATPEDEPARARHIADFIAGMTDRYALKTYQRLIGRSPLPTDIFI
jgi:dGTPase